MLDNANLRQNPFQTYRDPDTGHWVTVVSVSDFGTKLLGKRPPTVVQLCLGSAGQPPQVEPD